MLPPAPHQELSLVVPVLNEAATLAPLFATLAPQQDVSFELVICDGGSVDGTVPRAHSLAGEAPFPVTVIGTAPGRGRQMNAGARAARSGVLLFLHADSRFPEPTALRDALTAFSAAPSPATAGRFRLRFDRATAAPSLPWYFYEWKARLQRPGCIHGDQGLLVRRSWFDDLGGFDESDPVLEDVRLAEKIAARGSWLLLPAEIATSDRRFAVEGLRERQTLNALLMNFAAIGWGDGVRELVAGYRSQSQAQGLRLGPILCRIAGQIAVLPQAERRRLWLATGGFVRANAWQLPLLLDVRRQFRRGAPVGTGALPLLALHDRWFDRLTDNRAGRAAAALLTWLWFRLTLAVECRRAAAP